MDQKPSTILFNPKFKNAHINPNFLHNNKIHINPRFLNFSQVQPENITQHDRPLKISDQSSVVSSIRPALRNTRRSLIRAPAIISNLPQNQAVIVSRPSHQLIKISKNKLVTATHYCDLIKKQHKENELIKNTTQSIIKTKNLQRKTEINESIYKFDRRNAPGTKKKIVKTYSIRRVDAITPKKVIVSDRKFVQIEKLPINKSPKGHVMVNINGVLYNSTSKKLERTQLSQANLDPSEKLLIIRGENFILDSTGTKLKRDTENEISTLKLSRISIGGLTYKASQSGSFERDNSHHVRNHLSTAKTKSIFMLAKSQFQRSNIICPIYRRLGKCLAYSKGRCQNTHDQRYVIVCKDFVRNYCKNEKCLFSHNPSYHNMPVCKYFLQGLCQKQRDCLYLHKKMTDDTKLCAEFLKGYCHLADKCNLLHDFPETDKSRFKFLRSKPKKSANSKSKKLLVESNNIRYYIDDSVSTGENAPKPKALPTDSLPSYIPL